jgi:hypothetical protein
MAKYRITSIPQSLPKAQDGLEKKKGQTKSKLRNFFYGDGTQPKLAMDLFNTDFFNEDPALVEKPQVVSQPSNYPMIPVDGQEQFDMFNLRTEQERANTLPTIWNRTADQQVQCPEGKYPYKGECFSEEMYVKLMQEEMDDEQYRFDVETAERNREFENKMNQIRQERIDQQNLWEKEATDNYILNFKKSKKSDKIEPLHSISSYKLNLDGNVPMVDAEGNPIIDEKTGEPKYQTQRDVLQQAYLVIEDKENGVTKLYPKEIVYDRIIRNGFQADQFKNIWGIDPKQVKNQVGDVMNAAAQQYDATMKQKILQRAMDEGKTIQQVVSELSPKLATKEGAKSFIAPTQKIIDDALAEIKRNIEEAPDATYDNNLSQDEKIFFSNNPVNEWERTYHPNMFSKYYIDKYERGQKAYDDWMKRYDVDIYEGNTFAKDDRMANQRAKTQFDNRIITRNNAESAKKSAENKEFDKAFGKYAQHISSDFSKDLLVEAINNLDEKGKLKFLTDIQKNPKDQSIAIQNLLNTKEDGKTYTDRLKSGLDAILERRANPHTIKQGSSYNINEDNFTKVKDVLRNPGDAFYYWMNPRENMWDVATNLSYSERKKLEDENPGLDLGTMPTNVMSVYNWTPLQALNPFKVGFNLREGLTEGKFAEALGKEAWDIGTSLGFAKGANAMKSIINLRPLLSNTFNNPLANTSMLLSAPGLAQDAYSSFQKGDYLDAAKNAAFAGLSAAPLFKGVKTLNQLRKFGTAPINSSIGFQYTTPSGKTLSLMPALTEDVTLGKNVQEYFKKTKAGKDLYRGLSKELHPDVFTNKGLLYSNVPQIRLQGLKAGENTLGPGYSFTGNRFLQSVNEPSTLRGNLGRFGKYNFINRNQYPIELKDILLNSDPILAPFTRNRLLGAPGLNRFQKGGSLPKYQLAGIVKGLKTLGTYADDVAEGGNFLKYAWKSPAMRFDPNVLDAAITGIGNVAMPQSQALFDQIQDLTASDHMRDILLKDYEISSYPYTGRFGTVDPMRAGLFDQLTDVAKIQTGMPLVMSRRINLENPKLYSLESGIYNPERPLSFSAGRDQVGNKQYSGATDRLVLKLKPGQYNILKNMYPDLTDDQIAEYGEFLNSTGKYFNEAVVGNMNMAKLNRSGERELITPRSISFGEFGRVKNNFGGTDVLAEPIGLESKQPTWVLPTREDLAREFAVEHQRKGLGFFNSEDEFMNAINLGTVKDVTTDLDKTIGNRSFTTDRTALRNLISGYGSWPQYRNDATLQRLYSGLNQGAQIPMPIVIQYNNGLNNRILSGNTRMDASRHLGLTPQALFINATNYKKGGQLKSKMASVAAQLTQDEINQYIAQGYIVEEE